MQINTTSLLSSDQKLNLCLRQYLCEAPKGILILVHGMSECKERYDDFAKFLCEHHYHVFIADLRGHGESVLSFDDFGYFYNQDGQALVEDLYQIVTHLKKQYPNLPCLLFTHSMGTLIGQCFLKKYANEINGITFCGQPCKNPLATPGLLLAKIIQSIKGDHYRSNLLQNMAITPYDKKIEGTHKNRWLSHDLEVVKAYNENDKCGFIFTTNGFINLLTLIKKTYKKEESNHNENIPIFMIAGEKDPVIGNRKKFEEEISFLKMIGYKNIKSKLYKDLYHEILNEYGHELIYQDILCFYDEIIKNNP